MLALSTLFTITTVFHDVKLEIALAATIALLLCAGLALAISHIRNRRPTPTASHLTPWQRRTWSAPTLELVKPPVLTRPRLLTLALLRGYIIVIVMLLLLKLAGALPG